MAWGVRNLIFTQVGELYDCFTARGATVVGFTDQDGYDHYDSKAIRDDKFCGLMCDEQNQMDQSEDRATAWVEHLQRSRRHGHRRLALQRAAERGPQREEGRALRPRRQRGLLGQLLRLRRRLCGNQTVS